MQYKNEILKYLLVIFLTIVFIQKESAKDIDSLLKIIFLTMLFVVCCSSTNFKH